MIAILSDSLDPYFNLALEEYVFERFRVGEVCLIWRNGPALICGRHQNIFEEIYVSRALERGIAVVRRLSGGGTVWHDAGNVNFTFIRDLRQGESLDYAAMLDRILSFLRGLGIPAALAGICDIAAEGRKVSGSAQYASCGRFLHHGTLLFNADLKQMDLLRPEKEAAFTSKAKKSMRSPVANLTSYPALRDWSVERFIARLLASLCCQVVSLTQADRARARAIAKAKYETWAWNYAMSPPFSFCGSIDTPDGEVEVRYRAEQARIRQAEIRSHSGAIAQAASALLGKRLYPPELTEAFAGCGLPEAVCEPLVRGML